MCYIRQRNTRYREAVAPDQIVANAIVLVMGGLTDRVFLRYSGEALWFLALHARQCLRRSFDKRERGSGGAEINRREEYRSYLIESQNKYSRDQDPWREVP